MLNYVIGSGVVDFNAPLYTAVLPQDFFKSHKPIAQLDDCKCNVVVYGVEECPQDTPRSAHLVRDTNKVSKIFGSTLNEA